MLADAEADAADRGQPVDPLADLLFGLIAIIIPIFAVLLPMLQVVASTVPPPSGEATSAYLRDALRVNGQPVQPFIAGPRGLDVASADKHFVETDRILDDRPLVLALERLRDQRRPVLLLIEPDGQESAFLFETVAALHGPAAIMQLRLDEACAYVRDAALAARCAAARVAPAERQP